MFDLVNKSKYYKKGYIFFGLFLFIELIIRPILQPDPWIIKASHWYFNQPLRLAIELVIVVMIFTILKSYDNKILVIKKNQFKFTFIASCISILIFSFMELGQLKVSFSVGIITWVTWFLTGLFVGVGQELIYRGLIYEFIHKRYGDVMTNIIVTMTFILMPLHSIRLVKYLMIGEYQVVLLLVVIYAFASFFFTWIRKETNNVAIPAIIHGIGNAITWVAVFSNL